MNPWALLVILLGIVIVIIGVKGSQHNIASAITGHNLTGQPTVGTVSPSGSQAATTVTGGGGGGHVLAA